MGINTMDYVRGVEQASGIYAQALHEYSIENTKLERENAKLRELVRNWYELAVGGADSLTDWNHEQADLENRMRELGFEVDG